MDDLREMYDAVVMAYGADGNRSLGIAGEDDTHSVMPARHFVSWYNGHPDFSDLSPDLSFGKDGTAVVIGQGNVAMDCARMLLGNKGSEGNLANSDVTGFALEALRRSGIQRVVVVGRRGVLDAAFTIKEFREMTKIDGCGVEIEPEMLDLSDEEREWLKGSRPKKRLFELMEKSSIPPGVKSLGKKFCVQFQRRPVEILTDQSTKSLTGVRFEKTRLEGPVGNRHAVGTGEFETIPCDLLLTSIGYKSSPMPGVPFDQKAYVIPNARGRVLDVAKDGGKGSVVSQLYCSGWVKRGPRGVILSTMNDAFETADSICEDLILSAEKKCIREVPEGKDFRRDLVKLVKERGGAPVLFKEWLKIENEEFRRGADRSKCAEKITKVDEMLKVAFDA